MKKIVLLLTIIAPFLMGCPNKKDVLDPNNPPVTDKVMDTAIAYTQDIYYWNKQLPANMTTSQFKSLDSLMNFIKKYSRDTVYDNGVKTSKIRNVDRWSFAILKSEWDKVSQGIAGDFGLDVFFRTSTELRVRSVEKLSPAGLAGIKRGWQVSAINGVSAINDDNIPTIVNALFRSTTATITFTKHDATTQTITLSTATYKEQPIQLDTVYNQPSGKIGYMVLNTFLGDSAYFANGFARVFNRFVTEGVSNVVIDLRYNGGGYVSYQQDLANYLVHSSGDGKMAMMEQFNDKYARWNESFNFKKKGGLNLTRVYFIVSSFTASASELIINNLLPYMPNGVKIVGSATEGKAVGFFPIGVGDYYIFPVSFRSINGAMKGNYYDGFIPDKFVDDRTGLNKDWGDITENSLAAAITAINNGGVFVSTGSETIARSVVPISINRLLLNPARFNGLIDNRRKVELR